MFLIVIRLGEKLCNIDFSVIYFSKRKDFFPRRNRYGREDRKSFCAIGGSIRERDEVDISEFCYFDYKCDALYRVVMSFELSYYRKASKSCSLGVIHTEKQHRYENALNLRSEAYLSSLYQP